MNREVRRLFWKSMRWLDALLVTFFYLVAMNGRMMLFSGLAWSTVAAALALLTDLPLNTPALHLWPGIKGAVLGLASLGLALYVLLLAETFGRWLYGPNYKIEDRHGRDTLKSKESDQTIP
jgi:hypothetical protein